MRKTINFKVEGNSYSVNFPNVGQYLDIEQNKMMLTNNGYESLVLSRLKTSLFALDLVDAISFLRVMCPELTKDLNEKSYLDIDLSKSKTLVTAYKKQIQPEYDAYMLSLMLDNDEDFKEVKDDKPTDDIEIK